MPKEVTIGPELRELGIKIAWIKVEHVHVKASSEKLYSEITNIINIFKNKYKNVDDLRKDPIVQAYRKTLWKLGIDPTKTRPSSEALARRILRGKPLPKINNVVDSGNAASLYYLVPIGLYDLDRVSLPLRLERCMKPCTFEPIGSQEKTLKIGTPVLVDASGYVVHVYPHRDSVKTRITESTRRLLALAAGVPGVKESVLIESLELFQRLLKIDVPGIVVSGVEVV